ncbi:hypothetical protein AB0F81_14330 [Actinoplanes sp. NPDC024001]|uniref:hypothetical protein n=1 Tax=Actinoplanes sp. NPDC024001 TaxID=3154598 RepID=UPI0033CE9296
MRAAIVAVTVALALGGCAGHPRADGLPAVQPAWASCADAAPLTDDEFGAGGQDALKLPRLDGDFRPVAAVVCRVDVRERADGGNERVAVEERAGDVSALVETLRLDDEFRTAGGCDSDLPYVPWLALLDGQGRWSRPGVPVDSCGKPRAEFITAYERLSTEQVSATVLRQ